MKYEEMKEDSTERKPSMIRILFVDDEPNVLEGLRRMLRPQRQEWDMLFAVGAEQALAELERVPIDVVVTDMRMPGIDGANLLKLVDERFPGVMRIVLSGQFDVDAGLRAVPVAHQFLTKPCDPERLKAAIDRGAQLGAPEPDGATRRIISAIGSLPSPSKTCTALMTVIQDQNSSIEAVGKIIHQDVAITAKVLQLANSAFFNLPRQVMDVRSAVKLLGLDVLRQLVISADIMSRFQPTHSMPGFSMEEFEHHSQRVASIAGALLALDGDRSLGVIAALLHDTGKLVLATRLPEQLNRALTRSRQEGRPSFQCEQDEMGTDHARIGAYLLNLWGLPSIAIDAISAHHQPVGSKSEVGKLSLTTVVHVANALAHEEFIAPNDLPPIPRSIDIEYLTQLGQHDRIPEWRDLARNAIAT